jgi:hypothetical protein
MLDTNQINQVIADGHQLTGAVQANWPAICAASVVVARELRNFNLWCLGVAEFVISHGGIGMLVKKLLWNPPAK